MSSQRGPVHTAIIDWDGTAVPACWPKRPTTFMPGFVKNMRRLHNAGIRLVVFSARLNPHDPFTGTRSTAGDVAKAENYQYIRDTLDKAGLTFISVWAKEGKPSGSVYVDDKGERYHGRPKSWDKVADKILLRLGKEDAVFPAYPMDVGE